MLFAGVLVVVMAAACIAGTVLQIQTTANLGWNCATVNA
jgi:hypothetical protein